MLPRPLIDRIRNCSGAFSRPTISPSHRLRPTLIWSRVRTIRPSAPGSARYNELFSPGIAGDFTPAPDQFFDACGEARRGCRKGRWPRQPTSCPPGLQQRRGAMSVVLATKRRSVVNLLRYLATGVLVAAALVAARYGWRVYVTSPWTRDGMVRVHVANVAPHISGQIVEVRTHDNQHVQK